MHLLLVLLVLMLHRLNGERAHTVEHVVLSLGVVKVQYLPLPLDRQFQLVRLRRRLVLLCVLDVGTANRHREVLLLHVIELEDNGLLLLDLMPLNKGMSGSNDKLMKIMLGELLILTGCVNNLLLIKHLLVRDLPPLRKRDLKVKDVLVPIRNIDRNR